MHAEKVKKIIKFYKITLPSNESLTRLASYLGMSENTARGYLNISNNRCAPRAIETQVAAINLFGGHLVQDTSYEDTLLVTNDDQTIAYELN